jgi:hypothetical protein
MNDCVKPKFKALSTKQTQAKFVLTCYHCGTVGHIRPNWCKLKSQRPWNKNDAPKKEKGVVESCVSRPKSRYVPPYKRQYFQRFVPSCHHCGKVGHTRPNYLKLKPYDFRISIDSNLV